MAGLYLGRKKGGCSLRENNPVNGEKVECVVEKVRKAYHWDYCEETMPGIIARPLATCDYLHLNLS